MRYFVYIATNSTDRVLYTGVTNDIVRRMFEHKNKATESFSAKYNVNKPVYFEEFNRPKEAIAAEKRIKGWTREKKIKLIESSNPFWKDLLEQDNI